jgi:small conductance mechanosensitive channel
MSQFIEGVLTRLETQFAPETVATHLGGLAANAMVAALTFAAFYAAWLLLNGVAALALRRAKVDATTASFSQLALKFVVLTLGAIQALSAIGINTAALLTSLGVAGLTVGFAARDALSNLISGILIFWDRPFVIGDLVEVEGHYGRVERITLRSTRVVTTDGRMLAVPNATIVNTVVASYTNFPNLRLDVAVTVGVSEDLDRVREILLELVRDGSVYLDRPAPAVVVTELNDYNVGLELRAWIRDEKEHLSLRPQLRERVYKALTAAQVDMPFETLRLTPLEVRTA